MSIDHNTDVQYQRCSARLHVSVNPITWSMITMWRDVVVVVVVVVVRGRLRAIPLVMKTMRKSMYGFPFLSFMSMVLRLANLRATGAPR